jgi:hypothetical protein
VLQRLGLTYKQGLLFWKKEAENFCETRLVLSGRAAAETIKSFLLLFFKKEGLSYRSSQARSA